MEITYLLQIHKLKKKEVVWTDGTVKLAQREEKVAVAVDEQSGDLPF